MPDLVLVFNDELVQSMSDGSLSYYMEILML